MSVDPEIKKIVVDFIEKRRQAIIEAQAEKGIKATGKSAAALRSSETANGAILVDGAGTFEAQEFGTPPAQDPIAERQRLINDSDFRKWIELKKYNVAFSTDQQRENETWRIANKVAHKGTYTFIKGKPTGIISESINDKLLEPLIDEVTNFYTNKITKATSDIIGLLKK